MPGDAEIPHKENTDAHLLPPSANPGTLSCSISQRHHLSRKTGPSVRSGPPRCLVWPAAVVLSHLGPRSLCVLGAAHQALDHTASRTLLGSARAPQPHWSCASPCPLPAGACHLTAWLQLPLLGCWDDRSLCCSAQALDVGGASPGELPLGPRPPPWGLGFGLTLSPGQNSPRHLLAELFQSVDRRMLAYGHLLPTGGRTGGQHRSTGGSSVGQLEGQGWSAGG